MIPAACASQSVLGRALLLLAPAITIVVATEFIAVGLLPSISKDMHLPLARAGELTGWWAFSAAVAGPIVTLAASRLSPRAILSATLILFAVGNMAIVVSTDWASMLLARIAQGALLPAFVSVGAAVVVQLAPATERGAGLARANLGFVLGVLLALPAGVAIARGGEWRLPFLVLAIASVPMAALVAVLFPALSGGPKPAVSGQIDLLRQPVFLMHLALSVRLFAVMFSAYTYLGAWMEGGLGLPVRHVAIALFLFGAAGLVGNGIATRVAGSVPMRATVVAMLVLVVAINLAARSDRSIPLASAPLVLWGIGHTASVTLSQVRVTLAGGDAPAFAMTMNISSANLGIAIGTFGGGWLIDRQGIGAIGLAPIGFAILALPLAGVIARAGAGEASAFQKRKS